MTKIRYKIKRTSQFKKDFKLIKKRKQKYDIGLLAKVVRTLAKGEQLAPEYKDHELKGALKGLRECHILPDWLLIYEIDNDELYLYLTRTGTHSDLLE